MVIATASLLVALIVWAITDMLFGVVTGVLIAFGLIAIMSAGDETDDSQTGNGG